LNTELEAEPWMSQRMGTKESRELKVVVHHTKL
jgi:hypothetical protein